MLKYTSATTKSRQIFTQNPQTSINIFLRLPATLLTPNALFHSALPYVYVAFAPLTFSSINAAKNLSTFLVLQGYSRRFLKKEVSCVSTILRHETLKPRPRNNSDQAPFVITFNPALPNASSILRKHINIQQSSARCKETFSCPPVLAYKRSPNLRDLLVRTKLRDRTKRQDKI